MISADVAPSRSDSPWPAGQAVFRYFTGQRTFATTSQPSRTITGIFAARQGVRPPSSSAPAVCIRLKGTTGKSLDELLEAAGDLGRDRLEEKLAEAERRRKPSLDELLRR